MSGALKAGSVYVAVTAAIGDFNRDMANVLKTVERTAGQVKAAVEPIASVGRAVGAGIAGVVYAAAKTNQAVKAHVDQLSATFARLASDVGRMLLPFLDALQQVVGRVTYAFEHMTAGQKRAVMIGLEAAVVAGVVGTAVGKLADVVKGASGLLSLFSRGISNLAKWYVQLLTSSAAATAAEEADIEVKEADAVATTAVADAVGTLVAALTAATAAMTAYAAAAASAGLDLGAAAGATDAVAAGMAAVAADASAAAGAMGAVAAAAGAGGTATAAAGAGAEALAAAEATAAAASAGLLGALGSLAVAALPWVAIAGAVVLALGALYKAWETNAGGIRSGVVGAWGVVVKATQDLVKWVVSAGGGFMDAVQAMFKGALELAGQFVDGLWSVFDALKKLLLDWVRGQAKALSGLFSMVGIDTAPMLNKVEEALSAVDKYASRATVNAALNVGIGYAKNLGQGITKGVSYAVDGTKMLAGDVWNAAKGAWEKVKGKISDMVGGETVHVKVKVDVAFLNDLKEKAEQSMVEAAKYVREFQFAHNGQNPYSVPPSGVFAALDDRRRRATGPLAEAKYEDDLALKKKANELIAGIFDNMAKSADAAIDEASKRAKEALQGVGEKLLASFGDLSSIVEEARVKFFAGGPEAAVASVFVDLLLKSQQFQHLVEVLNGIVGMVADTVGKLAEPFIPLLGAVSMILKAGLDALAPLFEALTAIIQPLVPPLVVLGELFQALAPVIALFAQAVQLISTPIMLLAGPAMHALFDVLKLVARVIITIVKAVGGVWNGIVGAIQSVLKTIGNFSIFGKKPLGFLADWADGLQGAMINTDALTASLQALSGLSWDTAQNMATQNAEIVRNRQELAKANEELSNVPNAFKVALARFNAQDTQTTFTGAGGVATPAVPVATSGPGPSSGWSTGGGTGASAGRPPPGAETGPTFHITTTINATNPAEAMDQYQQMMDKVAYKLTGSRGRPGRYAVPEGAS